MATKGSRTAAISQIDAVIQAMKENGGSATLGYLYQSATKIPGSDWSGTKTPFASIRRIVQDPQNKTPRFFRIRPGLWALRGFEAAEQQAQKAEKEPEVFSHAYYQGLLVELGNMNGWKTIVPAQDKNQLAPTRTLAEMMTLAKYPDYTYPELLRRGITVDVTWFREHHVTNPLLMPQAFYEVEHSTDIQNSLLKFLDLRDFRADFVIVADKVREKEFHDRLGLSGFAPLRPIPPARPLVRFLDYETLTRQHEKTSEYVAALALAG
jgi:hypothetical protein